MAGPAGPAWLEPLETDAPDVLACWRGFDGSQAGLKSLRRELRARVRKGDAPRILAQQEAVGDALEAILADLPDRLLRAPGGEEDWNVAQAFAHTTAARRFLAAWAALDAEGASPGDAAPTVIPSVPGPPDATRERLLLLLNKSRHSIREAATRMAGHETRRCHIVHPLVGKLRCGGWLLFIGIHDLMHLEQLNRLRETDAESPLA